MVQRLILESLWVGSSTRDLPYIMYHLYALLLHFLSLSKSRPFALE